MPELIKKEAGRVRDDQVAEEGEVAAIDWSIELQKHQKWMTELAAYRVEDAHAADDVMQEVLLAVYQQDDQSVAPEKIKAWLYRLVVRRAADYMRRRYGRKKLMASYIRDQGHDLNRAATLAYDQTDVSGSDESSGLLWVMAGERQAMLHAAMAQLPEDWQDLLTLKYTEHWQYKQLAERYGVTERVIEYRLLQAKKQLRQLLMTLESDET